MIERHPEVVAWQKHLELCDQCYLEPTMLCKPGARLLKIAADAVRPPTMNPPTPGVEKPT
jgi:hypothetical protein